MRVDDAGRIVEESPSREEFRRAAPLLPESSALCIAAIITACALLPHFLSRACRPRAEVQILEETFKPRHPDFNWRDYNFVISPTLTADGCREVNCWSNQDAIDRDGFVRSFSMFIPESRIREVERGG